MSKCRGVAVEVYWVVRLLECASMLFQRGLSQTALLNAAAAADPLAVGSSSCRSRSLGESSHCPYSRCRRAILSPLLPDVLLLLCMRCIAMLLLAVQ